MGSLNSNFEYNFSNELNLYFGNANDLFDIDVNPFENLKINCNYFDESTFISKLENCKEFILLSANIQSLFSKFSKLVEFISMLKSKNIILDLIALQEIWNVSDPNLFNIPGYQKIVIKTRLNSRGGGVGFYVKEGIKFRVVENLSIFNEKVFESICIQVESSNNKKTNFISLYRPPGNHPVLTPSQQMESFLESFEELLVNIGITETHLCTDSNIDLLKLNSSPSCKKFFEIATSHGYLNLISRATRLSSTNFSLIDQILTNADNSEFSSGVLIQDISDHFFTFSKVKISKKHSKSKPKHTRSFSKTNSQNFKMNLSNLSWTDILEHNDPELGFNSFFQIFSDLFNLHFPLKVTSFNINFHKLQGFMTNGLLISRRKNSSYTLNILLIVL